MIMGDDGTVKEIVPKHNRAVIFMSRICRHAVQYVNLSGKKWDQGRFSVQFWLGFNNINRFR
jgi:Rps23 Pro-64 3,4-dihydroxylase Tpa1-like proline 4-hydroxylase